nr:hypothetical protein [Photobacterium angustum]
MDQLFAIINNKAYERDANRSCHDFLSGYSHNPLSAVANQIALALRNEVVEATTVLIS